MPGNLCNSYRIKPRERQLIRGMEKGAVEGAVQPQGNWHTQIATSIYTHTHILHGFDNRIRIRIRIRFIVRVPWPYQLQCGRQRLAFSPLLPLVFISLNFFVFGTKTTKLHWVGAAAAGGIGPKPKAKSPQPNRNLNLSPALVMLIFNLRLQPNRKLIV